MRKAVIYTRVSTDAQAEKGFSLRDQEEKIRTYCKLNNIEVLKHFQEDYSAKNFNRPEWKLLMKFLQKHKTEIDEFIFLKWDRFSRNLLEALVVSDSIKKLGIKVTCIENDIDDTIPENKLYKAIMLTIPEIENERRSLNVIAGMRRAMKEGKWPRGAPVGYKNSRDENNNKIIIIDEEKASLLKEAFGEMAKGQKTQQDIRNSLLKRRLKISRSAFSKILQNKFYIGKIVIPEYADEPLEIVEGVHEAIIDMTTFNKVQKVLAGRNKKRNTSSVNQLKPELPLRGYMLCHTCQRKMTGSASKGNGGRYFYYHCNRCGTRVGAEVANNDFENLLKKIELKDGVKELMKVEVMKQLNNLQKSGEQEINRLKNELEKQHQRAIRLDDNYLDGGLPTKNYNELKSKIGTLKEELEQSLDDLTRKKSDYRKDILKGIDVMTNLHKLFVNSNLDNKRKIIGSIFPRKFVFEGNKVRTDRINEVIPWIARNSKVFTKKKRGQPMSKPQLSSLVNPAGFEPATS